MLSTCFLYILYSILYYTQLVDNKNFLEREEINVSNNSIISSLVECKTYKDKIIPKIISALNENGYQVETKTNNELFIDTDKLTEINSIIREIDIPSSVKDIIIDSYKTAQGVYIRLKFK